MGDIRRIGANSYYLKEGEAIVTFSSALPEDCDRGQVKRLTPPGGQEAIEIMTWGKDNDLPQLRENLIAANNIVPALIEKKRSIIVGNGLCAYKTRYEKGQDGRLKKVMEEVEMPSQTEDWLEQANFFDYLDAAAGEYVKHSLIIPELVRDRSAKMGIASIEVKECKYMRSGKKNASGKVDRWYWSGHWGKTVRKGTEEKKTVPLDVYTGEEKKQLKFILPTGDYIFNDGYYPIPSWWGSKEWIEMANDIPTFHKANFTNGYNLRWQVKIRSDYFLDYEAYNNAPGEDEKKKILETAEAKEQAFMDDINQFLAGLANAGRTVFTKFEIEQATGRSLEGIIIEPLEYDMKDEALLKLFDKSNTATVSAQGIHPTLANIETQGKLSSGTEIRNAFLMWLIINTSAPRRRMLQPLNTLIKTVNNWPKDISYGIVDYELTALSSNDAGMQKRQEPTQDAA